MAIVGLIPAAGHATRLQPLPGSKEVLEVGGRPVIDYLVDRMRAAGAEELRVVTRPEKQDVIAHAEKIGATVLLARPDTLGASLGAALAGLAADDIALLGFPDTLWEPLDGYRPLVEAVRGGHDISLGLWEFPEPERSDVVTFDGDGRISGILVKPADPPSKWCWEIAAARAGALVGLGEHDWPGGYLDSLCRRGVELHAVRFHGPYLDIGTQASLRAAASWAPLR